MKTWLKGGLIAGMIGLASSLIFLFGSLITGGGNAPEFVVWIFAPFMIISLPGLLIALVLRIVEICLPLAALCPEPAINPYLGFIIASVINFIFFFLIGVSVGWTISKAKSMKAERKK